MDKVNGWHGEINKGSYNEKYDCSVEYIKANIIEDYIGGYDVIYSASVIEHIGEEARVAVMHAL
ncbi:unnamed protein product, partial [marine sediment metagenome]